MKLHQPIDSPLLGVAVLCLTAAGCAYQFSWLACHVAPDSASQLSSRVCRQDQAGSAHIAILSIAPWDRYKDALQPSFKLSSDDAVKVVIPDTTALEEKVVNALAAKAKVALPTSGTTSSVVTTTQTGSPPSVSGTSTQSAAPGDVSKVSFENAPGGAASALPPGTSVLGTTLGEDPMLRYWVATALYQEVQLLDRYVKDAAVAQDYRPYLVRTQVTLMPWRRDLPYDAYVTVSLFDGDFSTGVAPQVAKDAAAPNTPRIIPLVVTDDLEATMHSRSVDQIRQLALALAGTVQGVGVAGDLQKVDETLRTILGRDFNSTFTIARASDNSVRLRFGAMSQANTRYAMIPQAHNVTFLVLVPRRFFENIDNARMLRAVAKTTLVDAERGTELPAWTVKDQWNACKAVFKRYSDKTGKEGECDFSALTLVEMNDYDSMKSQAPAFPESLWVDLVALRNNSQFSYARVNLPPPAGPYVRTDQTVTLLDDLKTATTVTVRGEGDLAASKLAATLLLTRKPTAPASLQNTIQLTSNATKISDDGRSMMFTFPSLKVYGLYGPTATKDEPKPKGKARKPAKAEAPRLLYDAQLVVHNLNDLGGDDTENKQPTATLDAIYVAKSPDEPFFSISTRAKVIDAREDGTGEVQVVVGGMDKPPAGSQVTLAVDGADLDLSGVSADQIDAKSQELMLTKNASILLKFKNLNAVSNVTLAAKDQTTKLATKPISLMVLERWQHARTQAQP